jgi:hypothetical protein
MSARPGIPADLRAGSAFTAPSQNLATQWVKAGSAHRAHVFPVWSASVIRRRMRAHAGRKCAERHSRKVLFVTGGFRAQKVSRATTRRIRRAASRPGSSVPTACSTTIVLRACTATSSGTRCSAGDPDRSAIPVTASRRPSARQVWSAIVRTPVIPSSEHARSPALWAILAPRPRIAQPGSRAPLRSAPKLEELERRPPRCFPTSDALSEVCAAQHRSCTWPYTAVADPAV